MGGIHSQHLSTVVGRDATHVVPGLYAAANLSSSVQAWYNHILPLRIHSQHLSTVVGRDATHVVVHGGDHGDWFPGHVNSSKDHSSLGDTGESCLELLWGKVVELKVDMVLLGATSSALSDFNGHGSADHIPTGQVLGHGSIPLHEPL